MSARSLHAHRGDAAVGVGGELDVLDHARGRGPWPAAFSLRSSVQRTGAPSRLRDREADEPPRRRRRASSRSRRRPRARRPAAWCSAMPVMIADADLEDVGDLRRRVDGDVAAERLRARRTRRAAPSPSGSAAAGRSARFTVCAASANARSTAAAVGNRAPTCTTRSCRAPACTSARSVRRVFEVERRPGSVVVVDDHRFGARPRAASRRLGDDDRDAVADEAHFVDARAASAPGSSCPSVTGHAHGSGVGQVVDQVGAGEHRDDAGHRRARRPCRSTRCARGRSGCARCATCSAPGTARSSTKRASPVRSARVLLAERRDCRVRRRRS